ncbi:MAG: TIGR00282 family metallophosphoesterase [Clostridia bacterium]|nr:TIGR00282 family metallophosphoesterase [Clostridia bacterium]
MKILCIGDIVGQTGRGMLYKCLPDMIKGKKIDVVIGNGENAAHGNGITKKVYEELCGIGINVITMGNHTWGNKEVIPLLHYNENIIRPANFDKSCPGKGSVIIYASGKKIGIINIIGRTYMMPSDSPFAAVDAEIEKLKAETNIIFVDFHAEATSEKIAMGWYLDGRVSAVFGTHTHVQTADEVILTNGTGYITDLGMTGPIYSVLGMDRKVVISRFIDGMPQKFEIAEGKGQFCGAVFDVDEGSGKCTNVERIWIRE